MKLRTFISPIKVLLLLMATFALWSCEVETTGEPRANILPETFISEVSPGVTTRVSWYGTDVDGRVETFEYNWDGGDWVETANLSETFPVDDPTNPYYEFSFSSLDDERTFSVRAIDDRGGVDTYPATVTTSPNTVKPETQINEGPTFGSTVGPDVRFAWSAVDPDGEVVGFEYTMDNVSNWTYVAAVDEGGVSVGERIFLDLAPGAHTFFVRAIDDLGAVDGTPAQTPFTVITGHQPYLVSTSSIVDGGGWFAGLDVSFSWSVNVEYYQGQLPEGYATYALDDTTGWSDDGANMQYSWRPATSHSIDGDDLTAGSHAFYVKVRDTQGAVSRLQINFSAAGYAPTKDILVVNGVAPLYGSEIEDMFTDSTYWGGLDLSMVDFWDLFGSGSAPGVSTIPAANYIGGGGAVTPDIFAQYKCVVWAGNSYAGDLELWNTSPVYPFLLAGGNLVLAARYGQNFFSSDLLSYAGIAWREIGVSIVDYQPTFPGLVACTPAGNSYVDLFSSYGFNSGGGCTDADITNYDGSRGFTNAAGTSTMLFAHRSGAVVGGFGYVRAAGVWAHPNLVYTDLEATTLPTPGTDEMNGNFIFLAGRNYRLGNEEFKTNMRYILRNIFGFGS